MGAFVASILTAFIVTKRGIDDDHNLARYSNSERAMTWQAAERIRRVDTDRCFVSISVKTTTNVPISSALDMIVVICTTIITVLVAESVARISSLVMLLLNLPFAPYRRAGITITTFTITDITADMLIGGVCPVKAPAYGDNPVVAALDFLASKYTLVKHGLRLASRGRGSGSFSLCRARLGSFSRSRARLGSFSLCRARLTFNGDTGYRVFIKNVDAPLLAVLPI